MGTEFPLLGSVFAIGFFSVKSVAFLVVSVEEVWLVGKSSDSWIVFGGSLNAFGGGGRTLTFVEVGFGVDAEFMFWTRFGDVKFMEFVVFLLAFGVGFSVSSGNFQIE